MNTSISLKDLAEKLNGNYWEKGDLKRIYLDRGHNTKKMSTKTFVWQNEKGEFLVSCNVDCPAQPWQWCKSQEDEVKESVRKDIENALAQLDAILVSWKELDEKPEVMVYVKKNADAEPMWYTEERFYEAFGIYPYDLWEEVPLITVEKQPETFLIENEPMQSKPTVIDEIKIDFIVGDTVKNNRFGNGTVMQINGPNIKIDFGGEIGYKVLIAQFAKLEKVAS